MSPLPPPPLLLPPQSLRLVPLQKDKTAPLCLIFSFTKTKRQKYCLLFRHTISNHLLKFTSADPKNMYDVAVFKVFNTFNVPL